jgi:hypothetical protein
MSASTVIKPRTVFNSIGKPKLPIHVVVSANWVFLSPCNIWNEKLIGWGAAPGVHLESIHGFRRYSTEQRVCCAWGIFTFGFWEGGKGNTLVPWVNREKKEFFPAPFFLFIIIPCPGIL